MEIISEYPITDYYTVGVILYFYIILCKIPDNYLLLLLNWLTLLYNF